MTPKNLILGTAGHIDHGKTTLVEALTGINTDRLPEEKRRGMSIELGFAPLPLSPDLFCGVIDVPGHERFISTMIGGAMGIDVALLVVAANEGICKQTEEHVQILKALGVKQRVCALTKSDLLSENDLQNSKSNVSAYLARQHFDADVIPVSAHLKKGLTELKQALNFAAHRVSTNESKPDLFLPIDRVFSLPGFGLIVTGTLLQGILKDGMRVAVYPGDKEAQIRSLQTFGSTQRELHPKVRAAVNLSGIRKEDIKPGQILVSVGRRPTVKQLRVSFDFGEKELRSTRRYRLYLQGERVSCRIILKEGTFQIRLQKPIFASPGERFVLRTESPPQTVAGGEVLEILNPISKKSLKIKKEKPKVLIEPFMLEEIQKGGLAPLFVTELAQKFSKPEKQISLELWDAVQKGLLVRISMEMYASPEAKKKTLELLQNHFEKNQTLTLGEWKELIGTSRKYALPWLTYFDQEKITLCKPDKTRIRGTHT